MRLVLELNEIKLIKEKAALMQISEFPEHMVHVRLFGEMKVSAHGGMISQRQFTAQRQALFTILLLNPNRTFSPTDLYDVISQDRESVNPANVVSSAVYRLRNHKVKKCVAYDREEWIVIEHNHEPIIRRSDFDTVQNLMLRDVRTAPKQEKVHPFSGFVFCFH